MNSCVKLFPTPEEHFSDQLKSHEFSSKIATEKGFYEITWYGERVVASGIENNGAPLPISLDLISRCFVIQMKGQHPNFSKQLVGEHVAEVEKISKIFCKVYDKFDEKINNLSWIYRIIVGARDYFYGTKMLREDLNSISDISRRSN